MGTRGLIIIKTKDNKYIIYNQFDSYPESLGIVLFDLIQQNKECIEMLYKNGRGINLEKRLATIFVKELVYMKLNEMKKSEIMTNVFSSGIDKSFLDIKDNYFSNFYNMTLSYDNVYKHIVIQDETGINCESKEPDSCEINNCEISEEPGSCGSEWIYIIDFKEKTFSIKGGYYQPIYNLNGMFNVKKEDWIKQFQDENKKLAKGSGV